MAESFQQSEGREILLALVKTIDGHAAYLSELDGAVGDGDHGINMNKGFKAFAGKLGDGPVELADGLGTLGMTLLTDIGGSMGPLYGTLFNALGEAAEGKDPIDRAVFGAMLAHAVEEVSDIGGAKVGDKTMMDTLIPAQTAYAEAVTGGASFVDALSAMAEAAKAGYESTKDMQAKIGRSARLGERSVGHLDAGATSCYLLLSAMATAVQSKLA